MAKGKTFFVEGQKETKEERLQKPFNTNANLLGEMNQTLYPNSRDKRQG